MSDAQPLSWKKVVLCGIGAVPVSMAISFGLGVLISGMVGRSDWEEAFLGIGGFSGMCVMVAAYLPLAALTAVVSSLILIRHRRVAHTLLAVLISLPIAVLVVFLLLEWG